MDTIRASSFGVPVSYVPPRVLPAHLQSVLQVWIDKQSHWPHDFSGAYIAKGLQLVHLPYWIVSGEVSGTWRADIGIRHLTQCDSCHGRGYVGTGDSRMPCGYCNGRGIRATIYWQERTGTARVTVENQLIKNHDHNLHCGEPNFKSLGRIADKQQSAELAVLRPKFGTSKVVALQAARDIFVQALEREARKAAARVGYVAKISLLERDITLKSLRAYLYPVYVGAMWYDGERVSAHVDAITGQSWVQAPTAVKRARLRVIRHMLYTLAVFAALGFNLLNALSVLVYDDNIPYVEDDTPLVEGVLVSLLGLLGAILFIEVLLIPIIRWLQNLKK